MFKNKGFLYGLGLGLILGASLLQLMNFSKMDDKAITNLIQSPSPSISPSIKPTPSLEPFATIKPTKPTETTEPPVAPSSTATPMPVATPAVSKTEEPAVATPKVSKVEKPAVATPKVSKVEEPAVATPAVSNTEEPAALTPDGTTVIIQNGMSSAQVSSLLFEKGIITDQKAFDSALNQLKLDRIIRIGTFTFLPDQKDEDIINQITIRK